MLSQNLKLSAMITGMVLAVISGVSLANTKPSIAGVVQAVDYAQKKITVITETTGEAVTYSFTGKPRIAINGNRFSNMNKLEAGQSVIVKLSQPTVTETVATEGSLEGYIVRVDMEQKSALIQPKNGRARWINFSDKLVVSGLHAGANMADLQKGHQVSLKYTAR